MKQILQNLSHGETSLVDVPCPKNTKSNILITTKKTVVSSGTERMLVDFGKANLLRKAKQQPEKVKMVLNKALTDGIISTFDAVRSKLDQPVPLGYCNAGVVLESDVSEFKVGDRVVSNGSHAEVVRIPKNLCAKIPPKHYTQSKKTSRVYKTRITIVFSVHKLNPKITSPHINIYILPLYIHHTKYSHRFFFIPNNLKLIIYVHRK